MIEETRAIGEPEIEILLDPGAVAARAAREIVAVLGAAIEERGVAHWVTTGGSAPSGIYRRLVEDHRTAIDWSRVELWWTDDRFVPHDHPLSNVKAAVDLLLDIGGRSGESGTGESGAGDGPGGSRAIAIPADQVHPMPTGEAIGGGHDPEWAAARYATTIAEQGPPVGEDGWPVFDLVLLGIGPDGHLLSVFPGSAVFDRTETVAGVPAPSHVEPHVPRVTLHPAILDAARSLLMVSTGGDKASMLHDVLDGERDVRRLPGQVARRPGARWLLDAAAAAGLDRRP